MSCYLYISYSGAAPSLLEALEVSPQVPEDTYVQLATRLLLGCSSPGFVLELQPFLRLGTALSVQKQRVFCLLDVKNGENPSAELIYCGRI